MTCRPAQRREQGQGRAGGKQDHRGPVRAQRNREARQEPIQGGCPSQDRANLSHCQGAVLPRAEQDRFCLDVRLQISTAMCACRRWKTHCAVATLRLCGMHLLRVRKTVNVEQCGLPQALQRRAVQFIFWAWRVFRCGAIVGELVSYPGLRCSRGHPPEHVHRRQRRVGRCGCCQGHIGEAELSARDEPETRAQQEACVAPMSNNPALQAAHSVGSVGPAQPRRTRAASTKLVGFAVWGSVRVRLPEPRVIDCRAELPKPRDRVPRGVPPCD